MLSYCHHLQQLLTDFRSSVIIRLSSYKQGIRYHLTLYCCTVCSVVAGTERISREVICEVTPVDDNDNQDNEMTVD